MSKIDSQKVTKPIQLLSAWLVGLIAINGSFLTAAANIDGWEKSILVVAAILNVPLFLIAIFVLQTKFRPELQEDAFYSKYLDSKTNTVVKVGKLDLIEKEIESLRKNLLQLPSPIKSDSKGVNWGNISINDHLKDFSELRKYFKDNSIPVYDVFGNARHTADAPKGRYISIDHGVSFATIIEILKIGVKFNMDGYAYYSAHEEESQDDVLFGSYINRSFFPIGDKLSEVLNNKPEPVDLNLFERDNLITPNKPLKQDT